MTSSAIPVKARRTAKADKPIRDVEPGTSYGFPYVIQFDPSDWTFPMIVDGDSIGHARTQDEARTTISTFCEELSRHTRATTADMAAETAAAAQGETNEPAPPRTVSELQDELDAVTNAILGVKRGTDAWNRLDRMRKQIVIDLNEAHRHRTGICHCGSRAVTPDASLCPFHAAIEAVSGTRCPSCGDPLPHCPCGAPAIWQVRESGGVYHVACEACYQRDFARNERRVAAWEADPLAVCPACRESGEVPYAALGEDPEEDEDTDEQGDPADEDVYAPVPVSRPGACRACGGAHHIQACNEVRAALLTYDYGAGTGGNPAITIAVPSDDPCAEVRAKLQKAVALISEASDALGWLQSFYNDVSNTAPEYFERCGDLNAVTYLMNEAAAIRERLDTVRRTGRI